MITKYEKIVHWNHSTLHPVDSVQCSYAILDLYKYFLSPGQDITYTPLQYTVNLNAIKIMNDIFLS